MKACPAQEGTLGPHEHEGVGLVFDIGVEMLLKLIDHAPRQRHRPNRVLGLGRPEREFPVHLDQHLDNLHRAAHEIEALSAQAGKLTETEPTEDT